MTDLMLTRTLYYLESREADLSELRMPTVPGKVPYYVRVAAARAEETSKLRRKFIAAGIARRAAA